MIQVRSSGIVNMRPRRICPYWRDLVLIFRGCFTLSDQLKAQNPAPVLAAMSIPARPFYKQAAKLLALPEKR